MTLAMQMSYNQGFVQIQMHEAVKHLCVMVYQRCIPPPHQSLSVHTVSHVNLILVSVSALCIRHITTVFPDTPFLNHLASPAHAYISP